MNYLKSHKLVTILIAILLVTIVGLISLRSKHKQADLKYFSEILAQAPCIENVCPGDEDLDKILERLSKSDRVDVSKNNLRFISLTFLNSEGNTGSGYIDFAVKSDNELAKVNRILFRPYGLNLATTLNVLGEPDEFLFISGCGQGGKVHAKLLYLKKGIEVAIHYETRHPASQMLTVDTPIDRIYYFPPTDFQHHLQETLDWYLLENSTGFNLHPSVTAKDFIDQIRPWSGVDVSPTPSADFCPR